MSEKMMSRYWINQPSTLQPDHCLNGRRVLAPRDLKDEPDIITIYFADNTPQISSRVFKNALSKGWPESK